MNHYHIHFKGGLIISLLILVIKVRSTPLIANVTQRSEFLECEFPPRLEEDLTHVRRKRLTAEDGLVCLEDYPYTVSIRLNGKHWCGGAIVGRQWVLSAAQCFDYVTQDEVSVRMGSVFRDFGGQILSAVAIKRHPEYRLDQYYPEHNLALIKLNIPISSGPRVAIVALPVKNVDIPSLTGEIVVTGYGAVMTGQIRDGENQELRRMITKPVSKPQCRLLYGNDYYLQYDHMCLQSVVPGVALCAGDTGDPAVHFSGLERGGVLYGIALFSGTEECAFKAKPGIYAKVAFSREWIDQVLSENILTSEESVNSEDNEVSAEKNSASNSKEDAIDKIEEALGA